MLAKLISYFLVNELTPQIHSQQDARDELRRERLVHLLPLEALEILAADGDAQVGEGRGLGVGAALGIIVVGGLLADAAAVGHGQQHRPAWPEQQDDNRARVVG